METTELLENLALRESIVQLKYKIKLEELELDKLREDYYASGKRDPETEQMLADCKKTLQNALHNL